MKDEEKPVTQATAETTATQDETARAEVLRRALDEGDLGLLDEGDRAALGLLGLLDLKSAGETGSDASLGELRSRGIAREAMRRSQTAQPKRSLSTFDRRRVVGAGMGLVAAAAVVVVLLLRGGSTAVPERLCSRSAGLLVPGPFPTAQTAAERLDVVAGDRLVAYRELRFREIAVGRGGQKR